MGRKPTTGVTKPSQFRLEAEVLAALDRIAAAHKLPSRAAAIRLAARNEAGRIKKAKPRKEGAK